MLSVLRTTILLALATLALTACEPQPPPAAPAPPVAFRDTTVDAALDYHSETFDISAGDLDGDDRLDVYSANHGAEAILLRTEPTGPWKNVLPASGVDPWGDQHGTALGDFDNDGDLDLYVSLGAARGKAQKANRLYRNDGRGRFTDTAIESGTEDPTGRSRSVAWLDVDRDGRLDLFLGNYATQARLFRGNADGRFTDATADLGLDVPAPLAAWTDYNRDLQPDLLIRTRDGLRLLQNEDGRFVDRIEAAGLDVEESVGGMSFADANRDGVLDLYLGYGTQYLERVVENGGEVRFALFGGDTPKGFDFEANGAAVDLVALHNGDALAANTVRCGKTPLLPTPDGRMVCEADAAIATEEEATTAEGFSIWRDHGGDSSGWHLRWTGAGDHHLAGRIGPGSAPKPIGLGTWNPSGGDLWIGRHDGTFHRAGAHGIEHDANVQSVNWADFNNDGWLDLYIVDGGTEGAGRPNLLFLNQGDGSFRRTSDTTAEGAPPPGGERASAGQPLDYDGDGRLDLLLLYGLGVRPFDKGPYQLLRNESAQAHWVEIQLRGTKSNRQGLGAWVTLQACGRQQARFYDGGRGSLSQSALPLHFGLGECTEIDSVEIRWPSGTVQRASALAVDQIHEVEEKA